MTPTAVARELALVLRGHTGTTGDPAAGWGPLLDLAARHQLLPGVWSSLRRQGLPALPPALAAGRSPLALLSDRHTRNEARTRDLRLQLDRILDAFDVVGISTVPIKGAHWLAADLLPDPAAREMIDLDLLIPPALATEATQVLRRLGYETLPTPGDAEPTDHQLAAVAAPGRTGSVELHLEPLVDFRRALLRADEVWDGTTTVVVDHMARTVPDPTTAMVLLIGHAQLQEDGARLLELPLRALHDLHEVGPTFRASVDWDEVTRRFTTVGAGGRIALAGFAVAARQYFGVVLPVPTTGGRAWLSGVETAMDRPGPAEVYRQAAYLPRALRAERMARLHGAGRGLGLWGARLAHVGGGFARRLRPGGR